MNHNVTAIEPDLEVQVVDAELDNTWGIKHIGVGAVHAAGNRGDRVKVGILDTGIDTDHPDLNYDPTCSASFVASEPTIEDGHSHGTHTAGTVAALDNDTGVVGVAPEVTLCIYKVFDGSGSSSYSDIVAAVQQAVVDGVQITNHSYGSSSYPGDTVKAAYESAETAAPQACSTSIGMATLPPRGYPPMPIPIISAKRGCDSYLNQVCEAGNPANCSNVARVDA